MFLAPAISSFSFLHHYLVILHFAASFPLPSFYLSPSSLIAHFFPFLSYSLNRSSSLFSPPIRSSVCLLTLTLPHLHRLLLISFALIILSSKSHFLLCHPVHILLPHLLGLLSSLSPPFFITPIIFFHALPPLFTTVSLPVDALSLSFVYTPFLSLLSIPPPSLQYYFSILYFSSLFTTVSLSFYALSLSFYTSPPFLSLSVYLLSASHYLFPQYISSSSSPLSPYPSTPHPYPSSVPLLPTSLPSTFSEPQVKQETSIKRKVNTHKKDHRRCVIFEHQTRTHSGPRRGCSSSVFEGRRWSRSLFGEKERGRRHRWRKVYKDEEQCRRNRGIGR